MKCLPYTVEGFLSSTNKHVLEQIELLYPNSGDPQIRAWDVLVEDTREALLQVALPDNAIVCFEFSLPTQGMAADLILAGYGANGKKTAFLIESKQWGDDYIANSTFSTYRDNVRELHPQLQVKRHALSFRDYLSIGNEYEVRPYVFLRNASPDGIARVVELNPDGAKESDVPVSNDLKDILLQFKACVSSGDESIIRDLEDSELEPSKSIFEAMKSIVTREEPFILTKDQEGAVDRIRESMRAGKRVIRVTGPAGSGKTAILLNLYVRISASRSRTGKIPIFISGRQNAALYKSAYRQIANIFEYPCNLARIIHPSNGNRYIVLMDEAQHNDQGVITQVVDSGGTVILCYDEYQTVSPDNPLDEFVRLEERGDFETIHLEESIRYNGSQLAEKNIKRFLAGERDFDKDDKFEFCVFDDSVMFEDKIFNTIKTKPDATLAVVSQIKFEENQFGSGRMFCRWGYQEECRWMPYVRNRNYLSQNGGKLWVGTWWLPGLDVDYVAVIIGDDLKITSTGPVGVLEHNKLFKPVTAFARRFGLPNDLNVFKPGRYGDTLDYVKSAERIVQYLKQPGNESLYLRFRDEMTKLIRNNYYIMMTRGCKGCFVYYK